MSALLKKVPANEIGVVVRSPEKVADLAALGVQVRQGRLPMGLPASVLLPQGRKGPAFIAWPNYRVLFDWNKSFVYVTTAVFVYLPWTTTNSAFSY